MTSKPRVSKSSGNVPSEGIIDDINDGANTRLPASSETRQEDMQKAISNPSMLGSLMEKYGYNYLGPGTDLAGKLAAGVKPVDWVDAAALEHDKDYANIGSMYKRGVLSKQEAKEMIWMADKQLWNTLMSGTSDDPYGYAEARIARDGMGAKILYDWLTDSALYAGLDDIVPEYPRADSVYDQLNHPIGVGINEPDMNDWLYDPYVNPTQTHPPPPGNEWVWDQMRQERGQWIYVPMDYPPVNSDYPVGFDVRSYPSTVSVDPDRDRNYIPDVLQKKRHRRRRYRPYGRRSY